MICFNLFQLPIDGNVTGFSDLKFSPNPAKVELQWRNFYDPESTIRQYDVQVQRAPYVYFLFLIFTSVQYQTSQKMNILIFAKFLVIKIN
jgi:hypothetical protein